MLRIWLTRIKTLRRIILVPRALRFLVTWSWNKLSRVALGTRMAPHKTAWILRRVEVSDIVTLLKYQYWKEAEYHGNRCGYSKDSCDKRRLFFVTRQVFPFLLFTIKYDYTEKNSFMSALSTRIVLDDSICSFRNLRNRYLDHDATCSICCKRDSNLCNGSLTKYTTGMILEEINCSLLNSNIGNFLLILLIMLMWYTIVTIVKIDLHSGHLKGAPSTSVYCRRALHRNNLL